MSNSNNNSQITLTEGAIPRSVIEEKIRNRSGDYFYTPTLWYNPENSIIYSDNTGKYNQDKPNYVFPVLNVKELHQAKQKLARGDTTDLMGVMSAGLHSELYPYYDEYLDVKTDVKNNGISLMEALDRGIQQGGMLTREDFLYIKTLETESNLVVPLPQAHVLTQAVTVIRAAQLKFKYAKVGPDFDVVTRKMSELGVPYTAQPTFTTAEISLDRYGTHIATTWEFRNETFDVDVYNTLLQFYRTKMDDERNRAIADLINAHTATPLGGTWTATTGTPPQMTRNPVPDIETLVDTVDATNLGNAQTIISNRKTYRAYHASTPWIVGTSNDPAVNPLPYESAVNFVGNAGKLFPGVRWIVDTLIDTGDVTVLDPRAIRFWDGPERTISYGMMQNEVEGTINKAYFTAAEVESSLIQVASGATA
jgi:hypothetical protein